MLSNSELPGGGGHMDTETTEPQPNDDGRIGDGQRRVIGCLTATRQRDLAIVWLLKDGGLRILELLALRLGDVQWGKRTLTVRATKTRSTRLVPVTEEAILALSEYVRLERPTPLAHD